MAAGDDTSVGIKDATNNTIPIDARLTANGDARQVAVIGNAGDVVTGVEPWGAVDTFVGPATLFYDTFVGPLDTTDKWTVTGNAPTFTSGTLLMSSTASTYNAIRTKDTVRANAGRTYVANGIILETTAATGAGRFWGLGTPATTPAAAVLAQDGIGFEVDQATGALYAVTYNAGVRTIVATLVAGGTPTGTGANASATVANFRDGGYHRFAFYFRATDAQWFVDNMQVPVATATFPNVATPELPALIVRQNAASFTGTPVFNNTAHLTADTARTGMVLQDPVVGTRQATINSSGGLATAAQALRLSGSSTTYSTSMSVSLGSLAAAGVNLPDLASVEVYIINNTNQATGNNPQLRFTDDVVGAVTPTVAPAVYAPFMNAAAAGGFGYQAFPLTSGYLRNASVTVAFGSAPTSGSLTVIAFFHGAAHAASYIGDPTNTNALRVYTEGSGFTDGGNNLLMMGRTTGTGGSALAKAMIVDSSGQQIITPHTDTARVPVALSVSGVASVTTEALMSLTQWRLGATTTVSTYTVPTGKAFRIQTIQFGARFSAPSTTVTFASTTFRVRAVASGTATATSAILHQDSKLAASNVATPNSDLTIADGLDLPAGYNFGVTHVASATTLAEDVLILGYEYTP